jgi:hypothetical protein
METAMSNKVKTTLGKFALKFNMPCKIRSVNLIKIFLYPETEPGLLMGFSSPGLGTATALSR